MRYKQIKWLILIIPTLTIGVWEYVRHEFLLPYISMELGNWLAPAIVFLVTILFLTQLFAMIEQIQEELHASRTLQAKLEERENIARELHDGIAQALFLLNVQVERLSKQDAVPGDSYYELKETVHRTNSYVREAIANLRYPPDPAALPWMQGIRNLIAEIMRESEAAIRMEWDIREEDLTSKEKIELLACIREALLNIHKHAHASDVLISGKPLHGGGWECSIADNGIGFGEDRMNLPDHYGLKMMRERAQQMGWAFALQQTGQMTVVSIRKEEGRH